MPDLVQLTINGKAISAPQDVAVTVASGETIRYGNRSVFSTVNGTNPAVPRVFVRPMARGTYLRASDVDTRRRVVVVGSSVAEQLFQGADPLGRTISIGGVRFRVIGVFASVGSSLGANRDGEVHIPVTAAQRLFDQVNALVLRQYGGLSTVDRAQLARDFQAKLDAACNRLEADARAEAEAARPAYEKKKAAYDAKKGRRGSKPKPPDDTPQPEKQSNLTDPDSALMRRSDAHEYRQAYNAQAVVCADGPLLVLATSLVATSADAPSFAATVLGMRNTVGLPKTVLADTGYASRPAVEALKSNKIEPLVAVGRTQPHRPYDFRPPPELKSRRQITEPWRIAMKAKMETDDAKALYKKRKQSVETVFGIIKSAMGFRRFHLRGILKAATEWTLIALAYNCRRIHRLQAT